MSTGSQTVENNLRRAASAWRRLRFWQHTGTLGAISTLGFLLLGVAAIRGWVTNIGAAQAIAALLTLGTLVAWFVLAIAVQTQPLDRPRLAGLLEQGQPKLLDRVHTLVSLSQNRRLPEIEPFYRRIARQAQRILTLERAPVPLSSRRSLLHLGVFAALLAFTLAVYSRFHPWQRLRAAQEARQSVQPQKPPEPPLELPAPEKAVEQRQPWGEVRIVDPGQDVRATRVDIVPLQIEAAANERLRAVTWLSTVNGGAEMVHELPAPADPRFGVYRPTINLAEWNLSDWDVVAYYARATTHTTNSYVSEVYFVEVAPFREELERLPGGADGQAARMLDELSALVSQQRLIIRQTHHHAQNPPESEHLREQDRNKLAAAETDVGKGALHLHAGMVSRLNSAVILEALEDLDAAMKSAAQASESLRQESLQEAQTQERSALASLAAARKAFKRVVTDHPEEFQERAEDDVASARAASDLLKEIAEFRDEARAAENFMQDLAQKQRALGDRANATRVTNDFPRLAAEEKTIQESLERFRQAHPRAFEPAKSEAQAAEQALAQSAENLSKRTPDARQKVGTATESVQKLSSAMQQKSAARQLADAYRLRRTLEQQATSLGQCENPGPGGGPSEQASRQTAAEAGSTLQQLKKIAEQSPASGAFGPALSESLKDQNLQPANQALSQLQGPLSPDARRQAAGQARQGLEQVARAFDQSKPGASQPSKRGQPSGDEPSEAGLERGLAQLDSLLKQLESQRPPAREDQAKQGREALYNLQRAFPNKGGSNQAGRQAVVALEEALKKGEQPLELEVLRRLLDQLQAFAGEVSVKAGPEEDKTEVTALDGTRFPPGYRGPIEQYFRKLSEKR